ncbi:hypothetical protein D9V32_10380 [Mycetocola tolaasinivorans]|uniref:Uncharacterized protein n=1 Tax=Mycetocola tolaasinivorans TaxID=76635 RepID=A0A3L7A4Y6_9MICO|nr:hypothetical protein [Mycetocola tolaasinivorans]RLP75287.1 hypothetical protein D9V32_10380 [Mycetocola tolaasinivorans]
MTGISTDPRATAFAAEVRARLADLGTEEITELTEGLEADLAERLADTDDLGDPAAYAQELRESAGLPAVGTHVPPRPDARERWAARRDRAIALTQHRRVAPLWRFVVSLRPVWWVARGWALFICTGAVGVRLNWLLPADFLGWLLLAAAIVLSVQWGRGAWLGSTLLRVLKVIVSIVAVIALLFMVPTAIHGLSYDEYGSQGSDSDTWEAPPGLTMNGENVKNIFAYDCAGLPLDRVQLFDSAGTPLTLEPADSEGIIRRWDSVSDTDIELQTRTDTSQGPITNAFPLEVVGTTSGLPAPTPTPDPSPAPSSGAGSAAALGVSFPFENARALPGCALPVEGAPADENPPTEDTQGAANAPAIEDTPGTENSPTTDPTPAP